MISTYPDGKPDYRAFRPNKVTRVTVLESTSSESFTVVETDQPALHLGHVCGGEVQAPFILALGYTQTVQDDRCVISISGVVECPDCGVRGYVRDSRWEAEHG